MYAGTYRIEGGEWQTPALFDTREEAEKTLGFQSKGRECIIAEFTVKRELLDLCEYCGRIITGYGVFSDTILRGAYCTPACIMESLQESVDLIQEIKAQSLVAKF